MRRGIDPLKSLVRQLSAPWLSSPRPAAACLEYSSSSSGQTQAQASSDSIRSVSAPSTFAALQQLQSLAAQTAQIAKLVALAAAYRDVYVAASSLHAQYLSLTGDPSRLRQPAPTARLQQQQQSSAAAAAAAAPPAFPVLDVSKLPDSAFPEEVAPRLEQRFMDKITCWAQLAPNHLEGSNHLLAGVSLFPPQEAAYPTYIDFNAALRKLEHHKSRKRVKMLRKLRRKRDKYQLSTWGHSVGEA